MTSDAKQTEQLTAYLDGELPENERAAVERWLATDETARKLLEELRGAARLVGSLPRARAPSHLVETVTARLEREALLGAAPAAHGARSGGRAWTRGLAVAAALALVVTAGWYLKPGVQIGRRSDETIQLADSEAAARDADDDQPTAPPREHADTSALGLTEAQESPRASHDDLARSTMKKSEALADEKYPGETKKRSEPRQGGTERLVARKTAGRTERGGARGKQHTRTDTAIPPEQIARSVRPGKESAGLKSAPGALLREAMSAPERAQGRFDRILSESVLSNEDLIKAIPAEFESQIVVELDSATVQALFLKQINDYMKSNRVPDARATRFSEPVGADQSFYFVGGSAVANRPLRAMGRPTGDVDVMTNLSQRQHAELIAKLEESALQSASRIAWTLRSAGVDGNAPVPEQSAAPPELKMGELRGRPTTEPEEADRKEVNSHRRRLRGRLIGGKLDADDALAPGQRELVTLAISLRLAESREPPPTSTARAGATATRPADDAARTVPRATTQGAPGD